MHDLDGLRVVDFTSGISGPYCTKLFADAGADVIKVEGADGDPMRRWSASHADLRGRDGALFRFLHLGKQSVVGASDDPHVVALVRSADVVVDDFTETEDIAHATAWRDRDAGLVAVSITPFGRTGPYAGRPATHFTIEAESGSLAMRGRRDVEPFQAGGRIAEWVAGTYAAVAALACARRARRTGHGETIDLSVHETMTISGSLFFDMMSSLVGRPEWESSARSLETPSIEPTADGWIGFNTNTRQQFRDFCALLDRSDLADDDELATPGGRGRRWHEWNAIVHEATTQRTTADLLEHAAGLRIPAAPVATGETVLGNPHFRARSIFRHAPDGSFQHPRSPFLVDGIPIAPPGSHPALGEHTAHVEHRRPRRRIAEADRALPLAGLRVVDLTSWWAGPAATHMLAILGAEVIKIESVQRPDGMRFAGVAGPDTESWWEYGFVFLSTNSEKRGVTLDLRTPRGVELARQLVADADVVIENYSPRVVEGFGLDWDVVHATNPRAVMIRMPAFGLDGPWRDRVGFAQTMEQATGMAWVTGHVDDQPRIPRGPCDPNAGMHAVFALLVALEERDRNGQGVLIEAPMIEGALNAAAEQVVEFSAYGEVLERMGNRSPEAAPQGLYRCRGDEAFLALSVATDAQWAGLRGALGDPEWARDPSLESRAGRHAEHDAIDEHLRSWVAEKDLDVTVDHLVAHDVPAAALTDTRATAMHPHLVARKFYEELEHPVVGRHLHPTAPFRFASVDRWLSLAAPTLGQHNEEVLGALGLDRDEISVLEADGVIGVRPV